MDFHEFWDEQDTRFKHSNLREQIHDVWAAATKSAREACAKIADERAMRCEAKAADAEDKDEEINLRSLAWQFSVLADEIRKHPNTQVNPAGVASPVSGANEG